MNEADLPLPEEAIMNSVGDPGQDAGSVATTESAAHLSSAQCSSPLAGDILHGAGAIAEFLYGDGQARRKVYHLVEKANLPVFRLGTNICARKSVLIAWIEAQERGPVPPQNTAQGAEGLPR